MSSPLGIGQPAPISEPTYSPLFPPRGAGPEDDGRTGSRRDRWETLYTAAVVLSDLVAITVAVLVGYRLGLGSWIPQFGDVAPGVGILAGTLMVAGMLVSRAWDPRILGQGTEEFSRVLRAVVISAVTLGMLGLAFQATAARPWVFGLMPMAGALAVLGRLVLRRRLHRLRSAGRCSLPVLAVGTIESVTDLIDRTRRDTARGWVVTGACTPTGAASAGSAELLGVPIRGDLDSVSDVVRTGEHRIVAVCPTPGWTSRRLHHLAWNLEDAAAELVVDPGLMEVAGPRLHVEPVDGLPLLRLTRPAFAGVPWIVKHAADKLGAVLGIMLVAPLFLVIAVGVKLDGGPVFFRQTRVGRHGREFSMLKFRSMVVDAEQRRDELDARNEGAGPLFKMRHDPRVTPFGCVPAPLFPRRAAPAVQRAGRHDVAGGAAATASRRGRDVRARRAAPADGPPGPHRPVADQRPKRPVVGTVGAGGPALRRELEPGSRRADPLANGGRGRPAPRRLLTASSPEVDPPSPKIVERRPGALHRMNDVRPFDHAV